MNLGLDRLICFSLLLIWQAIKNNWEKISRKKLLFTVFISENNSWNVYNEPWLYGWYCIFSQGIGLIVKLPGWNKSWYRSMRELWHQREEREQEEEEGVEEVEVVMVTPSLSKTDKPADLWPQCWYMFPSTCLTKNREFVNLTRMCAKLQPTLTVIFQSCIINCKWK